MKFRVKLLTAIFLIISVCFFASACDGNEKVLNVGCFPNVTHSQALYNMTVDTVITDVFGEDGIKVNWYRFNAGPSEMESFRAGKIDIGYVGPIPAITDYIASDGNIRIIAGVTNAGSVLITRDGAKIDSVADLAGKTVAVPQFGNTQDILLQMILKENGLDTEENGGTVKVIQQDNANIKALIEKKQIDAALVPEPWGSRLLRETSTKVLLDSNEILDGEYPVAVLVVRKDFLDENRELVKQFLKAHILATNAINDGIEASNSALNTVNEAIYGLTGVRLGEETLADAFSRLVVSTDLSKQSIDDFADMCVELGVIDRDVDANDIVDLSLLEEVLREMESEA